MFPPVPNDVVAEPCGRRWRLQEYCSAAADPLRDVAPSLAGFLNAERAEDVLRIAAQAVGSRFEGLAGAQLLCAPTAPSPPPFGCLPRLVAPAVYPFGQCPHAPWKLLHGFLRVSLSDTLAAWVSSHLPVIRQAAYCVRQRSAS